MKKTLKIHLLNIADDIRKNWWVLLLSVLLGLMAAYIYENNGWSQSNRGEYSATVRIYDRNSQVSNLVREFCRQNGFRKFKKCFGKRVSLGVICPGNTVSFITENDAFPAEGKRFDYHFRAGEFSRAVVSCDFRIDRRLS